jgi:NAD(P)-dependent dehydrogenase (short-subunit alcohol dehydrogenase family)
MLLGSIVYQGLAFACFSRTAAQSCAAIPDEDWLGLFQLNVMSGVGLSRHYLPRMVGKDWGRVVFVSSESGSTSPRKWSTTA